MVNKTNTTTAVASSQNPSIFGQSVTLTATLSPVAPGAGTPTGTVTFLDGGSPIGTGTLSSGSATFTTSTLATGSHTITASYGGDGNFNASTASLTGNPQVVNKTNTTTAVASSQNPSIFGQSVTLTATLSPVAPGAGTPTGTVTFLDGGSPIGTGTLSSGSATFTTSTLATGSHTITASYGGDGNFNGSTASLTGNPQVVQKPTAVTAISPHIGPTAGGTTITITGNGFTGATAVNFGGTAATSFTLNTDTLMSAISPSGSGTVDVTVTSPSGGTSAIGAADRFTYTSGPIVTAAAPNGGPPAGGTSVTITGFNFTGATGVSFGANAAASFSVNNSTSITATSPPAVNGTVDITVTSPNGTSAATAADQFSYASPRLAQQGVKLVGSGFSGAAREGYAVALSADGNTSLMGGPHDNSSIGTAWIFTRSGSAWSQVGGKLVGTGNIGAASEGLSVALSGDGNTAILGGPGDNAEVGAAWVFIQSGGAWTQQAKLVASDETGLGYFGSAVALSNDGNTALIGGSADSNAAGAVWVFTRNGNSWAQQGSKLVGSGAIGTTPQQGQAVALSGDGNTALIGGLTDNAYAGAGWVFTRSGGVWTQQGGKLTASDEAGPGEFGSALGLSSDGNTAIIGGINDNAGAGAAWIFGRSGGAWTQQGGKLNGTGAVGAAEQGCAVALSGDASTAAIGGFLDAGGNGAVWVFQQVAGVWTQKGSKVTGTDNSGAAEQGIAVALSADGRTLIEGGQFDSSRTGAAWILIPSGIQAASHDFNGDGRSDLLWRDSNSGLVANWEMNGNAALASGGVGAETSNWQIVGTGDFNGDGNADILWRDGNSGEVAIWEMNGLSVIASGGIAAVASNWQIVGTGDFNGDGKSDILWRDTNSGQVAIMEMNGLAVLASAGIGTEPSNWQIVGTGDFNGDGKSDILWRDSNSGEVAIWEMSGFSALASGGIGAETSDWQIVGTGDFNGDGNSDILWRDSNTGTVAIWEMNGLSVLASGGVGGETSNWQIVETGDFNGDGNSDILWRDSNTGTVAIWEMNGFSVLASFGFGSETSNWQVQSLNTD